MNNNQQNNFESDEITLKELILKVREYWREVWKNRFLVLLISALFASIFLWRAWIAPVVYLAELTFMVNEDEGGGLGGVASILGQFGLGGGSSGKFNLDKILELSRSRKIVSQVLFEEIEVDGKVDYIANHIIDEYAFHEDWEDDTKGLKDFYFINGEFEEFGRVENRALKLVYTKVIII